MGRSAPVGSFPVLRRLEGRAPGLTEGGVALVVLDTNFLPERLTAGSLERKGKYESRLRVGPEAEFVGAGGFNSFEILSPWCR